MCVLTAIATVGLSAMPVSIAEAKEARTAFHTPSPKSRDPKTYRNGEKVTLSVFLKDDKGGLGDKNVDFYVQWAPQARPEKYSGRTNNNGEASVEVIIKVPRLGRNQWVTVKWVPEFNGEKGRYQPAKNNGLGGGIRVKP